METTICKIDRKSFDKSELEAAAELLRRGELVAFPTETVYGLGGDALRPEAAQKIYAAKGRPSDNPLIVHIADIDALEELAYDIPEEAYRLADAFWPGPMTMILKKKACVPDSTTGGLQTVAIRMPSHEIARELIRVSGVYIAAPSANLSGRPSPTRANHVFEDMNGRIPMIIDGGACDIGLESSIIDLSTGVPTVLRPGYITPEDLEKVLNRVSMDSSLTQGGTTEVKIAKAPGMKYKHYAPKADLMIVEGDEQKVISYINARLAETNASGKKSAVLTVSENASKYACDNVYKLGSKNNEEEVAASLFAALRAFDDDGIEVAFSESFEKGRLGQAIMNRLLKAAGHKVINL